MRPSRGIVPCANPDCRVPTRSSKATLQDYPDTRARGTGGLCATCSGRKRRGTPMKASFDAKEAQHQSNVAGVEAYMAARRRRGVPPEGLPYECRLEDAA
jgi:hypothetical protein